MCYCNFTCGRYLWRRCTQWTWTSHRCHSGPGRFGRGHFAGAMDVDFCVEASWTAASTGQEPSNWGAILTGIGLGFVLSCSTTVFCQREPWRRWARLPSPLGQDHQRQEGPKGSHAGQEVLYVKHWYDVVVQSVRTRSTPETTRLRQKPVRATYLGKNILYVLVEVARVLTPTTRRQVTTACIRWTAPPKAARHSSTSWWMRCTGRSLIHHGQSDPLPVIKIDAEHSNVPAELSRTITDLEGKRWRARGKHRSRSVGCRTRSGHAHSTGLNPSLLPWLGPLAGGSVILGSGLIPLFAHRAQGDQTSLQSSLHL